MRTDHEWRPWGIGAAVVLLLGFLEAFSGVVLSFPAFYGVGSAMAQMVVAVGFAVAVALARRHGGIALTVVWFVGLLQVVLDIPVLVVEVAVVAVAFACARWGSRPVLWASALSIPVAAVVAVTVFLGNGPDMLGRGAFDLYPAYALLSQFGPLLRVAAGVVPFAMLAVPWLVGATLRSQDAAVESRAGQQRAEVQREEAERERAAAEQARWQAQEIADLRADQARLAHDVHDVVGHSLAVILAQAESAQYIPESDTERIRQTMATIATSARQSLRDVRDVLATGAYAGGGGVSEGLDALVDGVRSAGHDVRSTVEGTAQPLPPELNTVAYRVLQEMLTNALRHGRRGAPVHVERHWQGELRVEVSNAVAESEATTGPNRRGLGVDGMRTRLESVGGRLDVRRRQGPEGPTFTATAWIPLRSSTSGPVPVQPNSYGVLAEPRPEPPPRSDETTVVEPTRRSDDTTVVAPPSAPTQVVRGGAPTAMINQPTRPIEPGAT